MQQNLADLGLVLIGIRQFRLGQFHAQLGHGLEDLSRLEHRKDEGSRRARVVAGCQVHGQRRSARKNDAPMVTKRYSKVTKRKANPS